MKRGFLYVVFGEEYAIPFRKSVEYLRRVSKYPIAVLTNVKDLKVNVDIVTNFNMQDNENRIIRTQAFNYTPFEQTLLMDADSMPISRKVNYLFDQLDIHDFGFQKVREFTTNVPKVYGHALYKTKTTTPLTAYSGGVILFNKSEKCKALFDTWHEYWKITGRGRDMPSLACAIKNSNISFFVVDNCIDRDINSDTIIFHAYGEHDKTILPKFEKSKPFDYRNDLFKLIPVELNTLLANSPLDTL